MAEPAPTVMEIRPPLPGSRAKGYRVILDVSRVQAAGLILEEQMRTRGECDFQAVAEQLDCSRQFLYAQPALRKYCKAKPKKPKLPAVASRRKTKPVNVWDRPG